MSDTTKIQWPDATWNPWIGCTKVSAGCKNCYAENTTRARVLRSKGRETWGKGAQRSRTSEANWRKPLKWNRDASGKTMRVFPSLCDWLDDVVPIEWLADFLNLIHDTPNLTWILLTKRPENWRKRLEAVLRFEYSGRWSADFFEWHDGWLEDWPDRLSPPANVWILASVENQETADERIPELLKIPAVVRGLSVEPMLELVNLFLDGESSGWQCRECKSRNVNTEVQVGPDDVGTYKCNDCGYMGSGEDAAWTPLINWVIFGGESGPGARPCNVDWIRDGVRQCQAAGVPCFVKQMGSNVVMPLHGKMNDADGMPKSVLRPRPYDPLDENPLMGLCFRDKKGGDPAEWSEDLRVREFPKI